MPERMDLISVPLRTIPAVKVSMNSYSNEAFLFLMFMSLFVLAIPRKSTKRLPIFLYL